MIPRKRSFLVLAVITLIAVALFGEIRSRYIAGHYDSLVEEHLTRTADRTRDHLVAQQGELEREVDAVVFELQERTVPPPTAQLFRLLEASSLSNERGFRITDLSGRLVAWWGVELPHCPGGSVCFDVTDLYLVVRREVRFGPRALIVEHYARIPNGGPASSRLELAGERDGWVAERRFHAGTIPAHPPTMQFTMQTSDGSPLYLNLTAAPVARISRSARQVTTSIVALVTALLLLGWFFGIRSTRVDEARPTWIDVSLIAAARVALLAIHPIEDPNSVFGFYTYASRLLGPFARSPFDLLLTSAALLSIVVILRSRLTDRRIEWIRAIALPSSIFALVSFLVNLLENSRTTPIPDHITPETSAQGVLFAAILLLGAAVAEIACRREGERLSRAPSLVALALMVGGVMLTPTGAARTACTIAMISALLIALWSSRIRARILRLGVRCILISLLIYPATAVIEAQESREFIEKTWAPLVSTQADQLVTLVETSLDRQFSGIDLSEILPDGLDRTDLGNLAWVLWSRSSLSEWRVPSSVIIFDLQGDSISRFGIGLPEIRAHTTHTEETIVVGSVSRELLHRDYALRFNDETIAELTVYVVDPSDAGATTFSDLYRDLFTSRNDPWSAPLRTSSMPAVFDQNGTPLGSARVRLPRSPAVYLDELQEGEGRWVTAGDDSTASYVMRVDRSLYAFPLAGASWADHFRRFGTTILWAAFVVLLVAAVRGQAALTRFASGSGRLGFHARTSIYLTSVVILPLLIFVVVIRAYLSDRLEAEYLSRGESAFSSAQRVITDYLASQPADVDPDELLDDSIMTWLARVVGHELHLYRDSTVLASSRRDLFSAGVEGAILPGTVYKRIVLEGAPLVVSSNRYGDATFVEIYSPVSIAPGANYTLALPFIVQARQIRREVDDLATTVYLILAGILVIALAAAYRTAQSVLRPVQGLVGGARAVGSGNFEVQVSVPDDPDLGLLVTTFNDMAQSIRMQQDQLRQERDRLRTLLENIEAAVVVVDHRGDISATNASARRLFRIDDAPGVRFAPPYPAVSEFLEDCAVAMPAEREVTIHAGETARTYQLSLVALPGGSERMLISEDVTEILRSNRLQAWAEMARQVAHEIKNPLTPIQLSAEHLRTMAERNDSNLREAVSSAVANILKQVRTLRETSKDFSDYASLREPARETIVTREFFESLAHGYQSSGGSPVRLTIEIDPEVPETFEADPRMIRGAVSNLIGNAFEAVRDRGEVRLRVDSANDRVVIAVSDDGPGLPEEQIPRIFEPHFSTKTSGTGLGLAIARKTAEDHGGSIRAENLSPGFLVVLEIPAGRA